MTTHRLINWLMALAIVAVYAGIALLDGPSDHAAEQAQLVSLQDAIKSEAAAVRLARASAEICGENAAVRDLGDGTIQCLTKRGHKTKRVAL